VSAVPRHRRFVPTVEPLEGRLAPADPALGLRIATYNITSAGSGGIPREGRPAAGNPVASPHGRA
jgi:hypothetical protein